MLIDQPVRQIAYYVHDVKEAAKRHMALYGSGPFFLMEAPPLPARYRGKDMPFHHTTAFGQWGTMQVELLRQNDDLPSVLHDLYPVGSGRSGIHHAAIIVDDLEEAIANFAKAGYSEAMRVTPPGITAVFIDTVRTLGHFIELYEPTPAISGIYDMVAKAAIGFDGSDPIRPVTL